MEELLPRAKSTIPSAKESREDLFKRFEDKATHLSGLEKELLWMDEEGLTIFEDYQQRAIKVLVEEWLRQQAPYMEQVYRDTLRQGGWEVFKERILPTLTDLAQLVQKLEKDLGNMRKARGGSNFQHNLQYLLGRRGIASEVPSGKEAKTLGRIDLVVPSIEQALNEPDKAYFLTCKRTLRERWKQEVPQGVANRRFFLVTLDENISASKVHEIKEMHLIVYVRESVKERYPDKHWVRSLDSLIKDLSAKTSA